METSADRLRHHISDLLRRGAEADAPAARDALLERAAHELVPDEALILDHLAERGAAPLVHIQCWTRTGIAGEAVLENASTVGRAARTALPQLTPHYLSHLFSLGLVEAGPEEDRLHDEYQALLADPAVLHAMTRAGDDGVTPRVVRHTVRLSTLGRELWTKAFPSEGPRGTSALPSPSRTA